MFPLHTVLSFQCIHVSLSVRRVQVPYVAACLAITPTSRSVSYYISLSRCLVMSDLYIDDYTMHLLTLVLSFPCSIHRRDWPLVMAELLMVTLERFVDIIHGACRSLAPRSRRNAPPHLWLSPQ